MGQKACNLGRQGVGLGQIGNPNGAATHLIFIGWTNAPARRADLTSSRLSFAGLIKVAVQGQDQNGIVRQGQQFGTNDHALRANPGDLVQEGPRIDDDAVANDRLLALHHARRQQRELVGHIAHHQSMACIMPALEANHDIRAIGQPIDNLALTLVAPLGADHGDVGQ